MPNVRSQRLGGAEIEIVASDGRMLALTFAQVRTRFLLETGTVAQRRSKTIAWVRQQVVTALGAEQFRLADLDLDFDQANGRFSNFQHGAG